MASILVVDDAHNHRRALEALLSRAGYTVLTAASGDEALAHLEHHAVDVLLCAVEPAHHGRSGGAAACASAQRRHCGGDDVGPRRYHHGRGGHEGGGIRLPRQADQRRGHCCSTVQNALALRVLSIENLVRKRQVVDQVARTNVIGSSPTWNRVYQMVQQVAPSPATVLLTGESGTGRKLIAGLLHRLSPRAKRPFIVLNAAAMPATLLEAELFGYEKGAFTGALHRKPGHFELADGGTLVPATRSAICPWKCRPSSYGCCKMGRSSAWGDSQTLRVNVARHRGDE